MAATATLESREYKLLLEPEHFGGNRSDVADRFWTRSLVPIIKKVLKGQRGLGIEGSFGDAASRLIHFRDTKQRTLGSADFSLRERRDLMGGELGPRELTLKFRSADFLLAAALTRRAAGADMKFEEDISPLHVTRLRRSGERKVTPAHPPSIHSRYSVSLTAEPGKRKVESLSDLMRLYPPLKTAFESTGANGATGDARLRTGPTILERVYKDAAVELGSKPKGSGKVEGKFALSLWYFLEEGAWKDERTRPPRKSSVPTIAEISFAIPTRDGVTLDLARRATALFIAMQEALQVNHRETSKTALALPG